MIYEYIRLYSPCRDPCCSYAHPRFSKMVREMCLRSRTGRASHKSREITHETRTFDRNHESWLNENVAENTRTGLFHSLYPTREEAYRQRRRRWKARLRNRRAEFQNEERAVRRTMEGKAIPNRAGPSWEERNERGGEEGEPEGGWKSALWECQLRFLLPSCSKQGFESERVTYRSRSMRTNPSPSDFNRIE